VAGLLRIAGWPTLRAALDIGPRTTVGVVNTEGATDRAAYAAALSSVAGEPA
jgi:hypothetical protein